MPSSTTAARAATIALLAGCTAFGAYATFGTAARNGLLAAVRGAAGRDVAPADKFFYGGPTPCKATYTGVAAVDNVLAVLIGVFSIILSDANPPHVGYLAKYLLTQFLAGWVLMSVEGLRWGNRGRVVSWTGTFGFIFQNITFTVTVPIYLIIHLLTSPNSFTPTADALALDAQDVSVLPLSVAAAFVVPSVLMALPSPARLAPAAHYNWLALWQVFPVAQTLYHGVLRRVLSSSPSSSSTTPARASPRQIDNLYRAVAALSFFPHTALLALAAVPPRAVPVDGAVLALLARVGVTRDTFAHVTLARAFVPTWPWASPAVQVAGGRMVGGGAGVEALTGLVQLFLQWDVYVGGLAVLAWAVFVHSVATATATPQSQRSRGVLLLRVLAWTAFGGPVGAATMLLWERDASARAGAGGSSSSASGPAARQPAK